MRRQGEADAELWHPVIKPVVSPPAQRLPGLGLVRGGTKGTGGRWHGSGTKTARENKPSSHFGAVAVAHLNHRND